MGNFRLTDTGADNDVRHIILDFGDTPFPVLEGQSIGIVPPGTDANGKPQAIRLYSVASPRDGEKPNANNLVAHREARAAAASARIISAT